ncbi:helix-turn-helix domain-containing protein [Streptomyces sp. NPDC015237]|uniref:helix-turn-helix domain-containing protein n=1 Tax=unclassified Streptomyces TaxID=2593676 RepID=UPI0036FF3234
MSARDDDGGGSGEVAKFAALLRALKKSTDRIYDSLARRLGMNTSTLHRYCAGDAVPLDFAPVERFAALCGATSEQRLELHRRWLLAVAVRRRPRTAGAAEALHQATDEPDTAPSATSVPVAETDPAPRPPGAPAPPPLPHCPWYRRRRLVAALATGAVLGMLGALSALPDERRASADGPARVGGPTASSSAEAGVPARRDASPGPQPLPRATLGVRRPEAEAGHLSPARPDIRPAPRRTGRRAASHLDRQLRGMGSRLRSRLRHRQAAGPDPPPPAPQDAAPWATTQSAVHGGETLVQLSVQGRSETAVVLEALRVRVVGRAAPVGGNAYAMDQGCGGSLTPRSFAVDLDKDRPIARAVAGNDSGTPIPAVRMPYRVSAKDPEVLLVTAEAGSCGCRWYLELDWSSQGRTGTMRIDDDGRPFRTSSIESLPRYTYDTLGRQWVPYS